ncbi:hypothetical protein ATANTOWER_019307 [Ataeniobius toweri]|uniref:Uncharacterized protein n=1 Tax=Ataeniobius toweri TaxID=208326 RepID=A0ABU7BSG3_9TELE|nr:hypothetical protein [Ataeniobius toweri]
MEESRAIDIQRLPRAQEPQENHCRDYHNTHKEERGRVPGEPPSSHSAEAQRSCSDLWACLFESKSSHGPRDPRPRDISLPRQRPDIAQGSRPRQAATGSEPAHTRAPSPGHREPQVHQRAETPTSGR